MVLTQTHTHAYTSYVSGFSLELHDYYNYFSIVFDIYMSVNSYIILILIVY